jgi:hypothetical protein
LGHYSHFRFSLILRAFRAAVSTWTQFGANMAAEIPENRHTRCARCFAVTV